MRYNVQVLTVVRCVSTKQMLKAKPVRSNAASFEWASASSCRKCDTHVLS